jgi:hypothetical protein
MNTQQTAKALNLMPVISSHKLMAAKYSKVWSFTKDLQKLPGFKCDLSNEIGNIEAVKQMPQKTEDDFFSKQTFWNWEAGQDHIKDQFGEFPNWRQVTLSHPSGSYKFFIPTDNAFYYSYCTLLGIDVIVSKDDSKVIKDQFLIPGEVFSQFSKALKFVSKDGLRPALHNICLDIRGGFLTVVATDCYRLFYSSKYKIEAKDQQILLPVETCKQLTKIKIDTEVFLTEDSIEVNGKSYDIFTEEVKYPDWRCVVPEYSSFIEFSRDEFLNHIKKVMPSANRSTNQVKLHLNGSIALQAEDIDFNTECSSEFLYLNKNFDTLDIAFNGKFLIEALGTFKDKSLKMYLGNTATKAGLISNDKETALLMPLMLNEW